MSMRTAIRNFDSHFTLIINQLFSAEYWRMFFSAITVLGDPIAIIVITGGVMLAGNYYGNIRLAVSGAAIPVTVGIGAVIKLLVERARPISEYSANLGTFSFPSGHSTGSMIAFGLLAYIAFMKLPQPWGIPVATVLLLVPILVGISRVYLGAHYPSDVLAGWLLGIVGLTVIIFVIRPF